MSCWEVLGLTADADTRSIKRQYAVLLKQHRPDEDPVGFQRLREAYEQALDWSRFDDQPEVAQPEQAAPDDSQGRVRAARLLAGATLDDLDNRYQQANAEQCAEVFEGLLLERCLTDTELAQWAVAHLHWLSPWQRDVPPRLPESRVAQLLDGLYMHHEHSLLQLLDQQQPDAFKAALADLRQQEWLRPFERHERLNDVLPRLLLSSRFWSEELFESLCTQHDWNDRNLENRCPEPEWSQLQARNEQHRFAANQRRSAILEARDAAHRAQVWPMLVALLGMATGWAIHDLQTTDHTLMQTFTIAPTWALVIAIPTLILLVIWRPATDGYLGIDDWLAPRVAPWLSFRRPTPLVIREILPCWVLGLLIWIVLGTYALIGYALTLHALGLAQRVRGLAPVRAFIRRYISRHASRWLWTTSLSAAVLLMVAGLMYDNSYRIHRDEGLQPFMMSRCSGLKNIAVGCAP